MRGRMEKGGLFAWQGRIQERGTLRWHRDRSSGLEFRPAATPFVLGMGWRKLRAGRSSVVASLVFLLPEGKKESGLEKEEAPGPRTTA